MATAIASAQSTESRILLLTAIAAVLEDDGFLTPSPLAADARKAAASMLEWSSTNQFTCSLFSQSLEHHLQQCLPQNRSQAQREKTWSSFHEVRTSKVFQSVWEQFLQASVSLNPNPILYQYITDFMFKYLIKQWFPSVPSAATQLSISIDILTYEEKNAIRYAAGYIPRALYSKLEDSSHPLKKELILRLQDLIDEDCDDDDESMNWLELIDHGGLVRISYDMYMLIVAMEMEFQAVIHQLCKDHQVNLKIKVTEAIMASEDVALHWNTVSANWEIEEKQALFPMISDLWITMCGFSFASAWIEKYKEHSKKTMQKSKGLRNYLL